MTDKAEFATRPDHELRTPLRRSALAEDAPQFVAETWTPPEERPTPPPTTHDLYASRYRDANWSPKDERYPTGETTVMTPTKAAEYYASREQNEGDDPATKPTAEQNMPAFIDTLEAKLAPIRNQIKEAQDKLAAAERALSGITT
jgi:hypothetical protein